MPATAPPKRKFRYPTIVDDVTVIIRLLPPLVMCMFGFVACEEVSLVLDKNVSQVIAFAISGSWMFHPALDRVDVESPRISKEHVGQAST